MFNWVRKRYGIRYSGNTILWVFVMRDLRFPYCSNTSRSRFKTTRMQNYASIFDARWTFCHVFFLFLLASSQFLYFFIFLIFNVVLSVAIRSITQWKPFIGMLFFLFCYFFSYSLFSSFITELTLTTNRSPKEMTPYKRPGGGGCTVTNTLLH